MQKCDCGMGRQGSRPQVISEDIVKIARIVPVGLFPVIACLLFALAAIPAPLAGQTFFGSIVGTVSDSSGAVVPGATVTLTNLGTNESKTAQTDAQGNYQFVSLRPGDYGVNVAMSGFKKFSR